MLKSSSRRKISLPLWQWAVSILIIAIFLFPLYVLIVRSLKSIDSATSYLTFPDVVFWDNYGALFQSGKILRAWKNSAIITTGVLSIELIAASLASYPLARHKCRRNEFVRMLFLGVMMIPVLTILVGVYTMLVDLNAINTYWGEILVISAFGLPLSVTLLTSFVSAIPEALDEAAMIDGANSIQTFFLIIFPQLKPIIATVVILHGVGAWNEYAYAVYILNNSRLYTLTLTIKEYFSTTTNDYGGAAAAAALGILPVVILYLALQKFFVQGAIDSAIK